MSIKKAGPASLEPTIFTTSVSWCLVNLTLRYSQLFADVFHRHLLDIWMTWHRGELSIGHVLVQTMPATITKKDAVVFRQEFD